MDVTQQSPFPKLTDEVRHRWSVIIEFRSTAIHLESGIPKEDRPPVSLVLQRVSFPVCHPSNLDIESTSSIEIVSAFTTGDAGSNAIFLGLLDAPCDESAAVALLLIGWMDGKTIKIPACAAGPRPGFGQERLDGGVNIQHGGIGRVIRVE